MESQPLLNQKENIERMASGQLVTFQIGDEYIQKQNLGLLTAQ